MSVLKLRPSELGKLIIDERTQAFIDEFSPRPVGSLLESHRLGDWGNLSPCDVAMNESTLNDRNGILLSMISTNTETIFIKTQVSLLKSERLTEIYLGSSTF